MDEPGCPIPFSAYDLVTLAHGGGGRVMQRLIRDLFLSAFGSDDEQHDGAVLEPVGPIAVTTDAFTVSPRFFPGGDIGSLAIHGTVNDLAMCGARPRWLSAAFVLEEGLPLEELQRIVTSMASAARNCGVRVVTGDTKVVERGRGDGLYITTTGIGEVLRRIRPSDIRAGDAVMVSGPVGEHGTAVMLRRLGLPEVLRSDAASVVEPVLALLRAGIGVHALRDPTRGGLAAVLCELAGALSVRVEEGRVPVRPEVSDACELLGLDPLHVACEGRFVAFVAAEDAHRALEVMRSFPVCAGAAIIGEAGHGPAGQVVLRGPFGSERLLELPSGEQLPRIC